MTPANRALAITVALAALLSCASLIASFAVSGWFGTINDIGNAVLAVLCAALAVSLHGLASRLSIVAVLGAAIAISSGLVVASMTSDFYAGLVSGFGFGLIGLWLLMTGRARAVPRPQLAIAAGLVMALGLINIAGIVKGIEDQAAAPAWLVGAGMCWAGTYLFLPVWALSAARARDSAN